MTETNTPGIDIEGPAGTRESGVLTAPGHDPRKTTPCP